MFTVELRYGVVEVNICSRRDYVLCGGIYICDGVCVIADVFSFCD